MTLPLATRANVTRPARPGSPREVFGAFLRLGLTSFGGPMAHLGYFHDELVVRRKWIDAAGFGELVALCQFLPGPTSSQIGFSLGVLRGGGLLGGLAAWCAFTLPSALLLLAAALGAASLTGPAALGFLHGLKLVAVAVIAHALWGMTRTLTPDRTRASIAVAAIAIVVLWGGSLGQIASIALGAFAGTLVCRDASAPITGHVSVPVSRRAASIAFGLFTAFLLLPFLAPASHGLAFFGAFYRSGALVFGGGHVVLPLLQTQLVAPGWLTNQAFLTGYGVAQAVPGPLFTVAVYLGAVMGVPPSGISGAAIAVVAIFLPGLLLVYGMLPFWEALRVHKTVYAATRGANAAVVGILGAALYNPVWVNAVHSKLDFALALGGFLSLAVWKVPPWLVVAFLAASGALLGMAHGV